MMNRNVLKTGLSMTRHFALTVAENQSSCTSFGEGQLSPYRNCVSLCDPRTHSWIHDDLGWPCRGTGVVDVSALNKPSFSFRWFNGSILRRGVVLRAAVDVWLKGDNYVAKFTCSEAPVLIGRRLILNPRHQVPEVTRQIRKK
jgi:hypothetical protein